MGVFVIVFEDLLLSWYCCEDLLLSWYCCEDIPLSWYCCEDMLWLCMCYRSTEDVFAALEDNQVQLSTMKASRFVKAFEHEVDQWERTLSHILEVTEMLLTVQRQWMYLEASWIFVDNNR